MREQRWKRLRTGLLIIAFSAIGMLEYVQLVQAFDLPQMMLVVPVVSVIAMLLLGKYSFFVPVCTIVLAIISTSRHSNKIIAILLALV